jgi:hypothetical protein
LLWLLAIPTRADRNALMSVGVYVGALLAIYIALVVIDRH